MINTTGVVVGTSAVPLVLVPPGAGAVTITVAAANTVFVYVGTSDAVATSGDGMGAPIVGGATVTIPGFPTSGETQLYAIASAASTPVGVFINTSR